MGEVVSLASLIKFGVFPPFKTAYIESVIPSGSAVPLANATAVNITFITLTPGEWDVSGTVGAFFNTTTNTTELIGSISDATGTLDETPGRCFAVGFGSSGYVNGGTTTLEYPLPIVRKVIAVATPIYLVARSKFTVSTQFAVGSLRARKVGR